MPLSYMTGRFLPVIRRDGTRAWIAPADVAAEGDAEVIRAASGNVLLDAFMPELLIGLMQYALAPPTEDDWFELFESPPDIATLAARLAPHAEDFAVFGPARAFQDPALVGDDKVNSSPAGRLLPTTPGAQTRKRNLDIFQRDIQAMRPEIAMIALAFIQAHSPAGGRGTRTSLTGGGPLRTLIEWDSDIVSGASGDSYGDRPFYRTVLANLLPANRFDELGDTAADVPSLPWLGTVAGRRGRDNTPATHLYFACPRRILLGEPVLPRPGTACDVTGETGVPLVTEIRQVADGPDYDSASWQHPLTPYYVRKDAGAFRFFPRLGASLSSGETWREKTGLYAARGGVGTEGPVPAEIVAHWRGGDRLRDLGGMLRLRTFGLRCDNATVTSFVDMRFRFRRVAGPLIVELDSLIAARVDDAQTVAALLRGALRDAAADISDLRLVEWRFWHETEATFEAYVARLVEAAEGGEDIHDAGVDGEATAAFRIKLWRAAKGLFDLRCAPLLATSRGEKVVAARRKFFNTVRKRLEIPNATWSRKIEDRADQQEVEV